MEETTETKEETTEELPEKIVFDLDSAIENALSKRFNPNHSVVLQNATGQRVELSGDNPVEELLGFAHNSLEKLNPATKSKSTMPGVN